MSDISHLLGKWAALIGPLDPASCIHAAQAWALSLALRTVQTDVLSLKGAISHRHSQPGPNTLGAQEIERPVKSWATKN